MSRRASSSSSCALWLDAAEQHRLRLQRDPRLAVLEHALGHAARLVGLVADGDELAASAVERALGPQVLGVALAREADHGVGRVEDRLRRAVVALQRHHARRRRELLREVEDVAHRRRAERVDRLRVVADDGDAAAVRLQRAQDRRLQPVGVLVLVDQHVVEARADLRARGAGSPTMLRPVQQQVVVVEDVLRLLRRDVGGEQRLQLALPLRAPREGAPRAPSASGASLLTTRE